MANAAMTRSVLVTNLLREETRNVEMIWFAPGESSDSAGARTVTITADVCGEVAESDEAGGVALPTNNNAKTHVVRVGEKPDPDAQNPVAAGQPMFRWWVRGNESSTSATVDFREIDLGLPYGGALASGSMACDLNPANPRVPLDEHACPMNRTRYRDLYTNFTVLLKNSGNVVNADPRTGAPVPFLTRLTVHKTTTLETAANFPVVNRTVRFPFSAAHPYWLVKSNDTEPRDVDDNQTGRSEFQTEPVVAPGESKEGLFNLNGTAGFYTLNVTANFQGLLPAALANHTNDVKNHALHVWAADLRIQAGEWDFGPEGGANGTFPGSVLDSGRFRVSFSVINTGDIPAGGLLLDRDNASLNGASAATSSTPATSVFAQHNSKSCTETGCRFTNRVVLGSDSNVRASNASDGVRTVNACGGSLEGQRCRYTFVTSEFPPQEMNALPAGLHILRLEADAANDIMEYTDSNNAISLPVCVKAANQNEESARAACQSALAGFSQGPVVSGLAALERDNRQPDGRVTIEFDVLPSPVSGVA
ncbi:MAG: hypothetical protein ACT4PT_00855, partial [Methanobacteriota archaeon]